MRLKVFKIVLTGTVALLGTGCGSTRSVTNSSTDLRTTESRTTEAKDSVVVEVHDTLQVVTVVTVDRNEAGDTVRVSTVTDRERVRNRDRFKAQETRVEVRVDTVFVAVRDSVYVSQNSQISQKSGPSAFLSALKGVFWIIVSVTVFIIVLKVTRVFNLF